MAWSLGLFGLIRLAWFEAHAVLPLTLLQGRLAGRAFGEPRLPVDVTLACSGADALALCAAAILAYPVRWPLRLAGAAGGTVLILALNTVRIGTLGRAAGSASWFEFLHLYAWPALLMLAIAAYVFTWMRVADTRPAPRDATTASPGAAPRGVSAAGGLTRRFIGLTAVLVVVFTAMSPWYFESAGVLAAAAFVARGAAHALRFAGVGAEATGAMLMTSRGAFLVTPECIATPLIPVYLAVVIAHLRGWRWRVPAILLAIPLFVGLGIARLLVVALPASLVASPVFLIHAFYQLVLAAVLVGLAAVWRHGAGAPALRRALIALIAGGGAVYVLGPWYSRLVFPAVPLDDPQGALAFLPAFQMGLYIALSLAVFAVFRWRPLAAGLALLAVSQFVVFAALQLVMRHSEFIPHVRDIRAWAVAAPLLIVVAMVTIDRPRR